MRHVYLISILFVVLLAHAICQPLVACDKAVQADRHAGRFESAMRRIESLGQADWRCRVERAMLLHEKGALGKAWQLLRTTQKVLEKRHGKSSSAVQSILLEIGLVYQAMGEVAMADDIWARYRANCAPDDPRLAYGLARLAFLRGRHGEREKGTLLFTQAFTALKRPNVTDLDKLWVLKLHAQFHLMNGAWSKAWEQADAAVELARRVYGPDHFQTALATLITAELALHQDRPQEAGERFDQLEKVLARVLEGEHIIQARVYHGLAAANLARGNYAEALAEAEQAAAIKMRHRGQEHPDHAETWILLAKIYDAMGFNDKALVQVRKALTLLDRILEKRSDLRTAKALVLEAELLTAIGEVETAHLSRARADEMYQALLGPDHPLVLRETLLGLSPTDHSQRTLPADLAEILDALETSMGAEHTYTMAARERLAEALLRSGDAAAALKQFQTLLLHHKAASAFDYAVVSQIHANLARCYAAQKLWDAVTEHVRQSMDMEDERMRRVFSLAAEKDKRSWFREVSKRFTLVFEALAPGFETSEKIVRLGLEMVLRRKGLPQDILIAERPALKALSPDERKAFNTLSAVKNELSDLLVRLGREELRGTAQRRIETLNQMREELETLLADAVSDEVRRHVITDRPLTVLDHMPKDATLLEMIVYGSVKPMYGMFIINSPQDISWRSLGPADVLDTLVQETRSAVQNMDIVTFEEKGGELVEMLEGAWSNVPSNQKLIIAPDGSFHLLPFHILPITDGFLLERHQIDYVSTGRDLGRASQTSTSGEMIVIANPQFGNEGERGRWRQLAQTKAEAQSIVCNFDRAEVSVLQGSLASEILIKRIVSPRFLHIATHGFYDMNPAGQEGDHDPITASLTNSGLVLAGANTGGDGSEDGLLTPLEVATLDLTGTELVVLSACQTGRGQIVSLGGVYGLRRAFQIAGARHVMSSLWPVGDAPTRAIMASFYRAFSTGLDGASALHLAMKTYIADKRARGNPAHPIDWGAFIYLGFTRSER